MHDNGTDSQVSIVVSRSNDNHNCDDKSKRSRTSVESSASSAKARSVDSNFLSEQLKKEALSTSFSNFTENLKANEKSSRTGMANVQQNALAEAFDPNISRSPPLTRPRLTRRQTISGASSPAFTAVALASTCIVSSSGQKGRQNGVAHRGLLRRASAFPGAKSSNIYPNSPSSSTIVRADDEGKRLSASFERIETIDRLNSDEKSVTVRSNDLNSCNSPPAGKTRRQVTVRRKSQRRNQTNMEGANLVGLSSKQNSMTRATSKRRLHTQLDSSSSSLLYHGEFSQAVTW